MKVLFICSYKQETVISPFVKSQAESLEKEGISVSFFLIKNKGLKGYLSTVFELRNYLKVNHFDIVHAHYSLSGFVASLAGSKKIVVSLMGSDVIKKNIWSRFIPVFNFLFRWKKVIVKSIEMENKINLRNAVVIPNGVDFNRFMPIEKQEAREALVWDNKEKIILFNGHKNNYIKNYSLAEEVVSLLDEKVRMIELKSIPYEKLYLYYNACDMLLSTSKWEGSPNVIKEAMACNTPIVATNVGDISYLFGVDSGNFCCDFNSVILSKKVNSILENQSCRYQNKGRKRLLELQLESHQIAKKIIDIYNSCM